MEIIKMIDTISYTDWIDEVDSELHAMTGKTSEDFTFDFEGHFERGADSLSTAIDCLYGQNYFSRTLVVPKEKYGTVMH